VLKKSIPTFNKKIAEYLTEDIANFKLKFEIDDDNLKILTQKYGDIWRDIKSAGGMETVISSWIVRAVLTEFSILPKSDMLILDEGFGAFDTENIGNIDILFEKFKEKFSQVMVISHVPIIADFCDNLLEVVVDDTGFSYISNI
jgi:DNA repair exonuclease SbcCD ATPase subunit